LPEAAVAFLTEPIAVPADSATAIGRVLALDPKLLYHTLGVPWTATAEDMKRAYRRQSIRIHPDKNPGDPRAGEAFGRLSNAYEVLSDETTRRQYHQEIERGQTEAEIEAEMAQQFEDFVGGLREKVTPNRPSVADEEVEGVGRREGSFFLYPCLRNAQALAGCPQISIGARSIFNFSFACVRALNFVVFI